MMKFLVSNKVGLSDDFYVGIAPGKFDTKQLILSALVVLELSTENRYVQFVRTINKDELAKCRLFINDDFTTVFPQIPSYHDIDKIWKKNSSRILNKYSNYEGENLEIIQESIREKICNLEAIDCIMELYETSNPSVDSFEEALEVTLKLIEKFISDSLNEVMFYQTIKSYVQKAKPNYVHLPVYVQGWRSVIKNIDSDSKIRYAIFSEDNGNSKNYIIESFDKGIIMKKFVKGLSDICYSGRYFIKATSMDAAIKVIERMPLTDFVGQEQYA